MPAIKPIPPFVSTQPGNQSGVYAIANALNGRLYVGSSAKLHTRWLEHIRRLRKNKSNHRYLQNAWNKYGEDAFVFGVIEFCNESDLLIREKFYLDTFLSYKRNYGYNTCIVPDSCLGVKRSDEARARISIALKEASGRSEVKARRSAAMKARMSDPGERAKLLAATREAHARPEYRANLSASATESWRDPDAKARRSAAIREAMGRPEVRARMSAAAKESRNRPEAKIATSIALKEIHGRPDVKARHVAAIKASWVRRKTAAAAKSPLVQRTLFDL